MAEAGCAATLERRIAAPAGLVWALASDTNRWDRVAGVLPTHYRYESIADAALPMRERIGTAPMFWGDASWIERGEWIEGRSFRGERRFREGPIAVAGYKFVLSPEDGACGISAEAWIEPRAPLQAGLQDALERNLGSALARYYDAIARVAASADPEALVARPGEPAAATARRALLCSAPDAIASGASTPVSASDLLFCAERFSAAPVDEALRGALLAYLRERTDAELLRIRPYELAEAWRAPRRDLLRAFLHAARAGLVDLRWELTCPFCRVGAEQADSLAALRQQGYCLDCDTAFHIDFAQNVEAVFQVNRAIRALEPAIYCAGSPFFRPHVLAAFELPARALRQVRMPLPAGRLAVRSYPGRERAMLPEEVSPDGGLRLELTTERISVQGSRAQEGDADVVIANETDRDRTLLLERADYRPDIVLGSDIFLMPDFLDLYSAEAPATGVDLQVGSMAVLFTDLTDSTALYVETGDARAFALIQDHFRLLDGIATSHGGAIVKTMGDAVMASFPSAGPAFAAAIDMVRQTRDRQGHHGLKLKVGLHSGPCLAVRANQRLDFFGTTVNLASRLASIATGGHVLCLEELLAHPDVSRRAAADGLVPHHLRATLKGMLEPRACVAFEVS